MKYVQFYTRSTGYVEGSIPPRFDEALKLPIEACGDRGVMIVDASIRPSKVAAIAASEAVKRGYIGYRVFQGRTFTDAKPISGFWPVPRRTDTTAASASYGA